MWCLKEKLISFNNAKAAFTGYFVSKKVYHHLTNKTVMRKTFLLFAAWFFYLSATAQYKSEGSASSGPAKAIYVEIGGPGLASLNYDMRFKGEDGAGFRVGLGGFSIGTSGDRQTAIFIPVGFTVIKGKDGKNYFELGGGVTPVIYSDTYNNTDNFTSTFGHLNIGYRLQPRDGGFFFRAAINPVFGRGFFWPYYGGVAFGYKF